MSILKVLFPSLDKRNELHNALKVYWNPYTKKDSSEKYKLKKSFGYPYESIEKMRLIQRFFNIIQMLVIGGVALLYAGSMLGWFMGVALALMAVANEFVDNENITAADVEVDISSSDNTEEAQSRKLKKYGRAYLISSFSLLFMVMIQTSLRMTTMITNALINFGVYNGKFSQGNFIWPICALVIGLCSGVSDVFISLISHIKYYHKALFSRLGTQHKTEAKKQTLGKDAAIVDNKKYFSWVFTGICFLIFKPLTCIKHYLWGKGPLDVATILKPYFAFLSKIFFPFNSLKSTDFYLFLTMVSSALLYFFCEFFNMKTLLEQIIKLGICPLSPPIVVFLAFVYGSIAYINQLALWGYNNFKFLKNNESLNNTFEGNFSWVNILTLGPYTRKFIFYLRVYSLCVIDLFSLLVLTPRKSIFSTLFFIILLISTTINKQIILHFQSREENGIDAKDRFNSFAKILFTSFDRLSFKTFRIGSKNLFNNSVNSMQLCAKRMMPEQLIKAVSPKKTRQSGHPMLKN